MRLYCIIFLENFRKLIFFPSSILCFIFLLVVIYVPFELHLTIKCSKTCIVTESHFCFKKAILRFCSWTCWTCSRTYVYKHSLTSLQINCKQNLFTIMLMNINTFSMFMNISLWTSSQKISYHSRSI